MRMTTELTPRRVPSTSWVDPALEYLPCRRPSISEGCDSTPSVSDSRVISPDAVSSLRTSDTLTTNKFLIINIVNKSLKNECLLHGISSQECYLVSQMVNIKRVIFWKLLLIANPVENCINDNVELSGFLCGSWVLDFHRWTVMADVIYSPTFHRFSWRTRGYSGYIPQTQNCSA